MGHPRPFRLFFAFSNNSINNISTLTTAVGIRIHDHESLSAMQHQVCQSHVVVSCLWSFVSLEGFKSGSIRTSDNRIERTAKCD